MFELKLGKLKRTDQTILNHLLNALNICKPGDLFPTDKMGNQALHGKFQR
jgi:hypothetical protein